LPPEKARQLKCGSRPYTSAGWEGGQIYVAVAMVGDKFGKLHGHRAASTFSECQSSSRHFGLVGVQGASHDALFALRSVERRQECQCSVGPLAESERMPPG